MVGQGFNFFKSHKAKVCPVSDILTLSLCSQKKSISNIQRNSSPSSSMKRPTIPYRYVFLLSLLCNYSGCWSNFSARPSSALLQPVGALWFRRDPTAGWGLALTMPSFHIMRLWDLLGHPVLTPGLIQLRHNVLQLNVHLSLLVTQVTVHTGINLASHGSNWL